MSLVQLDTPRRPRGYQVSSIAGQRVPMREQSNISRRRLFDKENTRESQQIEAWSEVEVKALVEFVLFHSGKDSWPCHKKESFWNGAAMYVKVRSQNSYQRTGNACRYKVIAWLKVRYNRPTDAEKYYFGKSDNELELLSKSFSEHCSKNFDIDVPDDFIQLSANAMVLLKKNQRSNVIYNLVKGLASLRPDQSDTRFPMKRMPMGLLEYMANFFVAEEMRKIPRCPDDYWDWQETMYVQFGSKWSKLHHGPMWLSEDGVDMNTMKARVNIPAMSERTLRRGISATCVTVTSAIQTSVLDEAAATHPNAWWWLKADGCDLNCGLNESVRLEWNGDVDLNDGTLQSMYTDYLNHLSLIDEIGSKTRPNIIQDLSSCKKQITSDLTFISKTLTELNYEYCEKQDTGSTDKVLFKLSWDLKELSTLNESGRSLLTECEVLFDKVLDPMYNRITDNFASKLTSFREKLTALYKSVTRYRRTAATHILVIMISPEDRKTKPYALPVQCVPYKGLKDMEVRELIDKVIEEMVGRGMKVAGLTTNGEWNTLRVEGHTRPLSIIKLRSDARTKYSRLGYSSMMKMLTPKVTPDGSISAERPNPAISSALLKEILLWKMECCTDKDIICRL